jgi:hypothetical protein
MINGFWGSTPSREYYTRNYTLCNSTQKVESPVNRALVPTFARSHRFYYKDQGAWIAWCRPLPSGDTVQRRHSRVISARSCILRASYTTLSMASYLPLRLPNSTVLGLSAFAFSMRQSANRTSLTEANLASCLRSSASSWRRILFFFRS